MTTSPASSADELLARVAANLARCVRASRSRGASGERSRRGGDQDLRCRRGTRRGGSGLSDVGENYVDELCEKRASAPDGDRGTSSAHCRSNKIARVVASPMCCAASLARRNSSALPVRSGHAIYVQVDFTGRAERNGVAARGRGPTRASRAGARARRARSDGGRATRGAAAREAFCEPCAWPMSSGSCERSMGMSDDLEIACELGSTEIRVGRALFGPRVVRAAWPNMDLGVAAKER